jgi:hypothetical protein
MFNLSDQQIIHLADLIVAYCVIGISALAVASILWSIFVAPSVAFWHLVWREFSHSFREPYQPSRWLTRALEKDVRQKKP